MDRETKTYIIETEGKEYYCGKTIDLDKRLKEHSKAIKGSWFKYKNRRKFRLAIKLDGDYEKEIKRFGVKKFYDMFVKEVFFKIYKNLAEEFKEVSLS